MHFDDRTPGALVLSDGETRLGEYVYLPTEPQLESPRPYALLRTTSGRDISAYRPGDHVWHKGLSLALPVVGLHNFWGGPTYVHGEGYVQLPNNGAQVHRAFLPAETGAETDAPPGVARVDESLDWVTEQGETVLHELRTLTARRVDADTWALTWRSALRNASGAALSFGSPTTKGRVNAGYAGIFWRGPLDLTGGEIVGPDGVLGDAARGEPGPWLALVAPDGGAGILMLDAGVQESPWFARSAEYAGLSPAPFFYRETLVEPGGMLTLAAAVVVGTADVAGLAPTVGAELVAELRAAASSPAALPSHTG